VRHNFLKQHELGHAFGYSGHYSSGDIMQTYYEDMVDSSPDTNELNYLGQVY
jgi:predicted Zn-dependent protease